VAFVTAIAVHIGWVVAHEPFAFDAWNVAVNSGAKPITLHRFFEFWKFEYTHSNPRIGQVFTYLTYKLDYFAVVATPLAYVALALAIVVLGTKRFPRKNRDYALLAFVAGAMWFALPSIGKMLFCRAYCANYIYTAAIQLWFLVPLRLGRGKPIPYFFAGVIAGMCNEHTGPTLMAFLVGYALWQRRKGEPNQLTVAGAAGVIVGFCIIFFAPGQGERYDGLANRVGLVGRVLQRGIVGNLDILRELLLASAPLLGLIVLVLLLTDERPRAQLRFIVLAIVAAVLVACTIFVSPKLGPRFFYVGEALLLAGLVGLVDVVGSKRLVTGLVVLSIVSAIYAGARTIPLYHRVKKTSDVRIAALEASKPGSVFIAEAFEQVDESWWFLGDDFRDPKKRDMVAKYFALAGVEHRAFDPTAPLGVTGARFVTTIDGEACSEPLSLDPVKGFDLTSLGQEITIAIEKLRTRPHRVEVGIAVDQPLPRPHVVVARWNVGKLEMHVGRVGRKGKSRTRDVLLPKELATPDVEVIVYRVNGEAKVIGHGNETPHYVPWKSGVYWILACRGDECFVIAATRHSA
jgi:hypothetical protein